MGKWQSCDHNSKSNDIIAGNGRVLRVYLFKRPQHNVSQRDKLCYQLQLIKLAFTNSTIVLGDFNLDWSRRYDTAYSYKNYYEDMEENLGEFNLNQLIITEKQLN